MPLRRSRGHPYGQEGRTHHRRGPSGIGQACAVRLAAQGFDVVGASRRTTPDEAWTSLVMDVDDDASVASGIGEVVRDHGGIDAVVTCAGWGLAGPVETTPLDDARAQLDTNFFGTVRVVAAALPEPPRAVRVASCS